MEQYNDYLMHFGVKGMKWGVRRYQNADGSLTAKGEKRYAKNEAYRQKLADKAQKKASRHKTSANEAKYNVKDLKTRGTKSEAYRQWKQDEYEKRERAYEEKYKYTDPKTGQTYHKSYRTSSFRFADDFIDSIGSSTKVQELIDENKKSAKRHTDAVKKWTARNSNLMNMEVSALTKKSDIRRAYRGKA